MGNYQQFEMAPKKKTATKKSAKKAAPKKTIKKKSGAKKPAKKASGKKKATKKKSAGKGDKKAKVKRAPSAYNIFMKKELAKLKNSMPKADHKERFTAAARTGASRRSKRGIAHSPGEITPRRTTSG